jgi:hypothetical protein
MSEINNETELSQRHLDLWLLSPITKMLMHAAKVSSKHAEGPELVGKIDPTNNDLSMNGIHHALGTAAAFAGLASPEALTDFLRSVYKIKAGV